jgi:hypothetical protein
MIDQTLTDAELMQNLHIVQRDLTNARERLRDANMYVRERQLLVEMHERRQRDAMTAIDEAVG